LLANHLDDLGLGPQTLIYRFKGKIWSELGHIKSRDDRRAKRNLPLEYGLEAAIYSGDRMDERISAEELLRQSWNLAKTPVEQRLLRASQLRVEGFSWEGAFRGDTWTAQIALCG
jgi:hypothetical protein